MANNDAYEQRRSELLEGYQRYLDEHGGGILLSPDVTVRLDFLNMTQIENRVLLPPWEAVLSILIMLTLIRPNLFRASLLRNLTCQGHLMAAPVVCSDARNGLSGNKRR